MLLILLAAGLGLRVVTQLAYRPAIFYVDSYKYLRGSGGYDPVGYNLLLKPILWAGNLATIAAVQHVLGLAMAVLLYLTLIRRHAPRWAAALATAPLLLDAYQLQIEQTIMPDVTFEAIILGGLAILLWNPRPRRLRRRLVRGGGRAGAGTGRRRPAVGEVLITGDLFAAGGPGRSRGGAANCTTLPSASCVAMRRGVVGNHTLRPALAARDPAVGAA